MTPTLPKETSASHGDGAGEPSSAESKQERLNRELDQLLQGLRVALPGVQVLFAFLLTVAFSTEFRRVDHDGSLVYVASVTLAAVASVLFIAPSVHHRLRFRDGIKEEMIRTANLLTLVGAVCLALAIGCALYVVGDSAFATTPARWIGPAVVTLAAYTWFILPLRFQSGRAGRD